MRRLGPYGGSTLIAIVPSAPPKRDRVQPFLDAGILNCEVFYHPNPPGWYQEARLLLSQGDPEIPKHPALTITENGKRLGKLNVLPYGDAAANLEHFIRVFGNPTSRNGKPVHLGGGGPLRTRSGCARTSPVTGSSRAQRETSPS